MKYHKRKVTSLALLAMSVGISLPMNSDAALKGSECFHFYRTTVNGELHDPITDENYTPGTFSKMAAEGVFGKNNSGGEACLQGVATVVCGAALFSGVSLWADLGYTLAIPVKKLEGSFQKHKYGASFELMAKLQLLADEISGLVRFTDLDSIERYLKTDEFMSSSPAPEGAAAFFADTNQVKASQAYQYLVVSSSFQNFKADIKLDRPDDVLVHQLFDQYLNSSLFCGDSEEGKPFTLAEIEASFKAAVFH